MGEAKNKRDSAERSRKIYSDMLDLTLESLEYKRGDVIVAAVGAPSMAALKELGEKLHKWGKENGIVVAIVPPGATLSHMPFPMLHTIYQNAKIGHEQRLAEQKTIDQAPPATATEREPEQEG